MRSINPSNELRALPNRKYTRLLSLAPFFIGYLELDETEHEYNLLPGTVATSRKTTTHDACRDTEHHRATINKRCHGVCADNAMLRRTRGKRQGLRACINVSVCSRYRRDQYRRFIVHLRLHASISILFALIASSILTFYFLSNRNLN